MNSVYIGLVTSTEFRFLMQFYKEIICLLTGSSTLSLISSSLNVYSDGLLGFYSVKPILSGGGATLILFEIERTLPIALRTILTWSIAIAILFGCVSLTSNCGILILF